MEEIKKLNDEPTQPKTKTPPNKMISTKTTKKSKSRPEIEELDKQFRDIKRPKNAKIGVRKLYSHLEMFAEKTTNNITIKSPNLIERSGKKMPMRLAKQSVLSYV